MIKWSGEKRNENGYTFECYRGNIPISSTAATFQVGTARKLFSTLTIYRIINDGNNTTNVNCIARGPCPLISINTTVAIAVNACTLIISIVAIRLVFRSHRTG